MKHIPISHKSFEKTSTRFLKATIKEIDSWSDDMAFKERFDSEVIYLVKTSISKLIKNYKSKPFKIKSAITNDIISFKGVDGVIRRIRVSYTIIDNILTFKLLTKVQSRFKRKSQFILKIK